jgi:peroxiredoxin
MDIRPMKQLFIALICCLFVGQANAQLQPQVLPSAVFYKKDGKTFSTAQIPTNKKAFIMFFDATCDHCQQVAKQLSKQTGKLANANIYLVSMDEFRSIDYFTSNFAKPLLSMKNVTLLQDKHSAFIPTFKPDKYPSMFLYGTNRRLLKFSSNDKEVPKFLEMIN